MDKLSDELAVFIPDEGAGRPCRPKVIEEGVGKLDTQSLSSDSEEKSGTSCGRVVGGKNARG